ncbi:DEAD/DEAH box helicase [Oceanobacter sp. 5_MG-2023]|uniref:DEAD/DEAH box helicase n=1 Tax=Oceanobacter sp. 5_MG-2023 TaxID=3062645 RepID=UPI0026E3EBFC|nr:DEAD/DEAH box helicase [Oceanobacter sp. 5_MG-2023]MDO6681569.1 DEAD/DEAH box helicase [Oceanobacter sp. 5_MG-2023]
MMDSSRPGQTAGSLVADFASLGLDNALCDILQQRGYSQPTAVQQQAIPAALAGRDLTVAASTGSGKTAAFVLPLLQQLMLASRQGVTVGSNRVRVLIVVPTRELAEQVATSVLHYREGLPLRSYAVYGGVSINPQMMALRKGMDILIATPGRLLDLYRQNAVVFDQLSALVLDEADRMLDLGFADELDDLLCALPRKRQTLLFSATFSDRIRTMIGHVARDPLSIDAGASNQAAATVQHWLIPVDKKRKTELLLGLLQGSGEGEEQGLYQGQCQGQCQVDWSSVLVFAKTRQGVDELAQALNKHSIAADAIHGDKTQAGRQAALQRFRDGVVRVLVATDVAARGLDIPQLPGVINVDLPINAEDYVHRVGRTGRAGSLGQAISLVSADEVQALAAIEHLTGQLIERRLLPGFEPSHNVPETRLGGLVVKKPKKPKQKKIPGSGQAAQGRVFDVSEGSGRSKSGGQDRRRGRGKR